MSKGNIDLNELMQSIQAAARSLNMKAFIITDTDDKTVLYGIIFGSDELKDHLTEGMQDGLEVLTVVDSIPDTLS
jgi:hypothetical protein